MHPNHALIEKLYTSLDRHLPEAMADCYHENAHFRDIAFDLQGRKQILAMWAMICQEKNQLRAQFQIVRVDDLSAEVNLVDDYLFGDDLRPVHNEIVSRFALKDGLILDHEDSADPISWAKMAFKPLKAFIAGRSRWLRNRGAMKKLREFVGKHPKYRWD